MIATHETTAFPAVDAALGDLVSGAKRWSRLPIMAKVALLRDCRDGVYATRRDWAQAAIEAKGLLGSPLAGEEWLSGPWALLYALNRYIATLESIAKTGYPPLDPKRLRERPDGQLVVEVFPEAPYDRLLLNGISAEVWMDPGLAKSALPESMASWYRQRDPQPRVALVLGAGNIAAIPALDVLYKLLADGAVCMLKMNPVNDYLGAIFERAFAPLVSEGYLRFSYGGAEAGKYLCAHDLIDEIHITGSDVTHDAIVFGAGEEGAARKRGGTPLLQKPITSELGNVSPTIVLPGEWSDADFRFQAEQIVTQKLHNDGFNCIAAQVLILPAEWAGTSRLIAAIQETLRHLPDRPAYYPGAAARCNKLAQVGDTLRFGLDSDGFTARTLRHADAAAENDPAFTTEAFSSFLAYVTLPGDFE
ncbi:MAG TPA: aldehyde dehydrogenase family protein, partial [Candidatus Dormibacteraeota bacterium]|nr:aldehyde dehydrogenase family protein [Candidatus Dormibacteraeota bacterium]